MTDLCMKPLGGAYRLHFVKYFAHATAREVLLYIFKLLRLLVVNGRWKTKETFFFKNSKGLFSSNFGPNSSKFGPSTLMVKLFDIKLVAKLKSIKRICLRYAACPNRPASNAWFMLFISIISNLHGKRHDSMLLEIRQT